MAFTVTEKVGACIFMVKCSYLEGRKKMIIDFCFPIASVLFVFFKQEAVVLVMYVGSVGTVCNLAKVEALQLFGQI